MIPPFSAWMCRMCAWMWMWDIHSYTPPRVLVLGGGCGATVIHIKLALYRHCCALHSLPVVQPCSYTCNDANAGAGRAPHIGAGAPISKKISQFFFPACWWLHLIEAHLRQILRRPKFVPRRDSSVLPSSRTLLCSLSFLHTRLH